MDVKGNSFNQGQAPADAKLSMAMNKQLKALLSSRRMTVAELSKATKISGKTIYHYLEGRSPRNLVHVKTICDYFEVSSDYLLFGEGSSNKQVGFENFRDEINAGIFEVILRKPKNNRS